MNKEMGDGDDDDEMFGDFLNYKEQQSIATINALKSAANTIKDQD